MMGNNPRGQNNRICRTQIEPPPKPNRSGSTVSRQSGARTPSRPHTYRRYLTPTTTPIRDRPVQQQDAERQSTSGQLAAAARRATPALGRPKPVSHRRHIPPAATTPAPLERRVSDHPRHPRQRTRPQDQPARQISVPVAGDLAVPGDQPSSPSSQLPPGPQLHYQVVPRLSHPVSIAASDGKRVPPTRWKMIRKSVQTSIDSHEESPSTCFEAIDQGRPSIQDAAPPGSVTSPSDPVPPTSQISPQNTEALITPTSTGFYFGTANRQSWPSSFASADYFTAMSTRRLRHERTSPRCDEVSSDWTAKDRIVTTSPPDGNEERHEPGHGATTDTSAAAAAAAGAIGGSRRTKHCSRQHRSVRGAKSSRSCKSTGARRVNKSVKHHRQDPSSSRSPRVVGAVVQNVFRKLISVGQTCEPAKSRRGKAIAEDHCVDNTNDRFSSLKALVTPGSVSSASRLVDEDCQPCKQPLQTYPYENPRHEGQDVYCNRMTSNLNREVLSSRYTFEQNRQSCQEQTLPQEWTVSVREKFLDSGKKPDAIPLAVDFAKPYNSNQLVCRAPENRNTTSNRPLSTYEAALSSLCCAGEDLGSGESDLTGYYNSCHLNRANLNKPQHKKHKKRNAVKKGYVRSPALTLIRPNMFQAKRPLKRRTRHSNVYNNIVGGYRRYDDRYTNKLSRSQNNTQTAIFHAYGNCGGLQERLVFNSCHRTGRILVDNFKEGHPRLERGSEGRTECHCGYIDDASCSSALNADTPVDHISRYPPCSQVVRFESNSFKNDSVNYSTKNPSIGIQNSFRPGQSQETELISRTTQIWPKELMAQKKLVTVLKESSLNEGRFMSERVYTSPKLTELPKHDCSLPCTSRKKRVKHPKGPKIKMKMTYTTPRVLQNRKRYPFLPKTTRRFSPNIPTSSKHLNSSASARNKTLGLDCNNCRPTPQRALPTSRGKKKCLSTRPENPMTSKSPVSISGTKTGRKLHPYKRADDASDSELVSLFRANTGESSIISIRMESDTMLVSVRQAAEKLVNKGKKYVIAGRAIKLKDTRRQGFSRASRQADASSINSGRRTEISAQYNPKSIISWANKTSTLKPTIAKKYDATGKIEHNLLTQKPPPEPKISTAQDSCIVSTDNGLKTKSNVGNMREDEQDFCQKAEVTEQRGVGATDKRSENDCKLNFSKQRLGSKEEKKSTRCLALVDRVDLVANLPQRQASPDVSQNRKDGVYVRSPDSPSSGYSLNINMSTAGRSTELPESLERTRNVMIISEDDVKSCNDIKSLRSCTLAEHREGRFSAEDVQISRITPDDSVEFKTTFQNSELEQVCVERVIPTPTHAENPVIQSDSEVQFLKDCKIKSENAEDPVYSQTKQCDGIPLYDTLRKDDSRNGAVSEAQQSNGVLVALHVPTEKFSESEAEGYALLEIDHQRADSQSATSQLSEDANMQCCTTTGSILASYSLPWKATDSERNYRYQTLSRLASRPTIEEIAPGDSTNDVTHKTPDIISVTDAISCISSIPEDTLPRAKTSISTLLPTQPDDFHSDKMHNYIARFPATCSESCHCKYFCASKRYQDTLLNNASTSSSTKDYPCCISEMERTEKDIPSTTIPAQKSSLSISTEARVRHGTIRPFAGMHVSWESPSKYSSAAYVHVRCNRCSSRVSQMQDEAELRPPVATCHCESFANDTFDVFVAKGNVHHKHRHCSRCADKRPTVERWSQYSNTVVAPAPCTTRRTCFRDGRLRSAMSNSANNSSLCQSYKELTKDPTASPETVWPYGQFAKIQCTPTHPIPGCQIAELPTCGRSQVVSPQAKLSFSQLPSLKTLDGSIISNSAETSAATSTVLRRDQHQIPRDPLPRRREVTTIWPIVASGTSAESGAAIVVNFQSNIGGQPTSNSMSFDSAPTTTGDYDSQRETTQSVSESLYH